MRPWIKRIAILTAGLFGLALFAVWLLLSSSLLARTRGELSARLLTDELGQVVRITGGVAVDFGAVLHVVAEGLVFPSQSMADVSLAEIGRVEFNVALRDLLGGRINLSDFQVGGARVALVVDRNGTSSWAAANSIPPRDAATPTSGSVAATNASSGRPDGDVVDFLADHRIRFSNFGLTYRDARNGLDLDLLLTSLDLRQKNGAMPVVLNAAGTLNGQELSLNGNFPPARPFRVKADFSQISVELDGTPDPGGYDAGYAIAVSADIAELGQLLDVLKLEKSVTGTGKVSAVYKRSRGSARIGDMDVRVTLDGGQSLELTADLGELGDPTDITVDTNIRLFSEANLPPPATRRRDLKLIGIDMQLLARPGRPQLRRMVIETNGFIIDTGGEGPPPIHFSEISRTPDGRLRIGKVVLRIGPAEAPVLVLEGAVADALLLNGIELEGKVALPVAGLFGPRLSRTSHVLGNISGGFRLSGNTEKLALSDLKLFARGSDLLNLNVGGSVDNVLDFSNVELDITAGVPSSAAFLSALNLTPVETGPVKLSTKLSSQASEWTSEAAIAVAESQLRISVDIDAGGPFPVVRGQIGSDLIVVADLSKIVEVALQLAKLDDLETAAPRQSAPADSPSDGGNQKNTGPLAVDELRRIDPASSENSAAPAPADASAPQPSGPFRDVTLDPLGRAILLSGMDLGVTVDIRRIGGKNGSSSLKTNLELKEHKARLGPVKFEYDGGFFDVSGSMDLNEAPDTLKLSGTTGGWNFGDILQELEFRKRASGVVSARFDVSGGIASVRDFLDTMNGTATLSMRNGSIDSQLLDLAGLGVIPWLFSKSAGAQAPIVCLRAPLYISNGRISTKQTVVETDQVQIVVLGNVDLKRKTLDIIGQPRRIGKPLSRSPWPFTAVGPIDNPTIRVKDGPRRLRRSDGASTMPGKRKLCIPDILQLK